MLRWAGMADPNSPIGRLPQFASDELRQLAAWNDTAVAYPPARCIHQLFEDQAARTPDAVALVFGDQRLSYHELDERANQLAHHLCGLGVSPEVLVGLCVERSLEMVVGLLAILKAGGAYVPLDPGYPRERLAFMLKDARPAVLLTQAHLRDSLPPHDVAIVQLDEGDWQHQPRTPPAVDVGPDHAIYVIYTSGSTGQPKGVLNTHRGLYNRLRWMQRAYGLKASDAILQKTPLSFDVSGWELWWPLIEGARMVIAAPEGHKDPRYLAAILAAADVTVVHFVPSMLAVFLAATEPRERASLRLVFASGEALPEHLRAAWYAGNRGELHNLYGPTEAAIDVTSHACRPDETGPVPIGKPIDNTRTYVLDAAFRPVPVGVAGELYLSGVQLARGYLHRPGLTAERFVPDPLVPGARMYRTGDLARFRDDGALEFLGRIDHQVKIRGFRIELGEIEAAIAAHPSVRDCVVVAREDATGDKRLVAYVVGKDATASELRERLGATVPEYMVPSAFVFLDALPLNPSGKVDRKALPAPETTRSATETYVAPRTDVERALVAIWEELLEVRPIGVRDDFFLLGGHSLLAFRVLSAIQARFGSAPSLTALLRNPTIEALAVLWDPRAERPAPPISLLPRADGEAPFAGLSGTERRIWFLEKLSPQARSYQIPHVFEVASALCVRALRDSVDALVLRHAILRTTYPEVDGAPRREVADDVSIPIRVEDVSALPAAQRDPALRAMLAAEVESRFDLERGPLTRVLAVTTAADRHVVVVHQHHIITDEWSWGLLLAELSSLYEASRRGQTTALAPLAYQYSDYARAERAALAGDGLAASRAYWKQALVEVPRLDLSIVAPAAGAVSGPEGFVSLRLSPEASRQLQALAHESAATPFMAWYAALAAVLSRYSGQQDFGLGAVVANRQIAGTEGMLGFFTNTVVLRTDLAGDPTFAELLARARRTALDAYEHQALPFDVVVQDQGLARQAGENPLFDVTFFEVTPPTTGAAAGWSPRLGAVPEGVTTAKNALAVSVQHTAEGTVVEVLYDTTRVSRIAAERLCGHLSTLVTDAAAHPDRRVSELELLTDEEIEKLAAWNDSPPTDPAARCIHELIAEQAVRAPQAVALEQDGQPLSYGEFEAQVNRLAHHLRALGVGPEVRVALCVQRSFDMVIGLVAILKAGGAFVPLDPSYPPDRLSLLLAEAGAPVLLTHAAIEGRLATPNVTVVRLDVDAAQWASLPTTPPASGVTLDHANYVVFTSGSTGKPKPVINEHRGLAARVAFQRRHIAVHPGDRILFSAAIAFDGAIVDWMLSLCNGATCVLPSNALDAVEGIAECLEHRAITFSFIPPAMLRVLRCRAPALRHITLAGDKTSPALVAQWAEGRQVLNSYGPTEFSIFAAQAWFDPSRPERFSIGRPVHGVRIHLLDGKMRQVPIGMPGEIHLAGVGLARGYLNRPAMTAERFLPDPFASQPGARMYCTGDLARWNEDGELEFLGRVDHQVKIRGFRVELGEVEAALASHPAVASSVVVAREDSPGSTRLVAYVVAKHEALTAASLREHLRGDLPDYMLPSAFVFLDALPLSNNGKIDRKALPAPEAMRGADEAFVAPRTAAERALAEVWSEVLRIAAVGLHDNFFALGGDSILAIQVVGRAKRAGLHVTVRDMFMHQTVAELVQVARSSSAAVAEQAVTGTAALTPSQQWFFSKNPEEAHHFNQAWMWTPSPALSPALVAEALQVVLRQHDALRLRYDHSESGWVQIHAEDAALPLARIDLSALPPDVRRAAVEASADDLQGSLSLSAGPVARAAWLDLGEQGTRLLLVVHHLVVDGVSWRILHEDLERVCEALLAGRTPALAAKTTSFRQWSERLHTFVAAGGLSQELDFWRAQCARGITPLPRDREAAPGTVGDSRTVDVELSEAETRALLHDVSAAYRTEINDVLLSALAAALSKFCDTDTVCVTLEGHGREALIEDVEVSRTVGWFTSMFPVWLTVPATDDPGTLLKGIKEQLRSVPNRGVGYGWLRYAHSDEAVRAALSVDPPVVFNYLGQFDMGTQGRSMFAPAAEPTGRTTSSRMALWHALAVNGGVWQGRLRFEWTYSAAIHDEATVARLAARFVASLRRIIDHCAAGEAFGYTPSDFPLARIEQPALDGLFGAMRDVESVYPLSPLQAGLLFHALNEPESPTYTVQLALQLGGDVDATALESAWKTVLARHAVYRTAFLWQGVPEPLQVVRRSVEFAMPTHDWSSLEVAEAEARWEALRREERAAGFDLGRAPLARVVLVRLPGGRTWMLKTTHHILADGWSMPVVLGELQAAYAANRGGRRLALPEPVAYERYIAWLATRDQAASSAFFAAYLAGVEEPTRLPFPPPAQAPAEATREHEQRDASLTAAETEALTAFARRHGLTLNTVVQGALAQLLGRTTGRTDVVFGVTTSGRSAPLRGIERMVGLFINTLPLRARWSGSEIVLEWLQRLQAEQVELRVHEATPLYEVQRASAVGGGRALFDTLLVFENYPVDEAAQQAEALPIVDFQAFEQTSYPLAITVAVGTTLDLRWMWEPAALRGEDIEQLWGHLRTVLLDMVAHPGRRLSELGLLTEAEHATLAAWNDTVVAYPPARCIHALFEEQAARTPDAVALVFGDQRLSYRELDERANQLAHHLCGLGVSPEVLVGLCVERSLEMVVGLLAILKAGGAYVPLDPGYPRERLAFMLKDARPAVLLTQARLRDSLPPHDVATVQLDEGDWQRQPRTSPAVDVGPDHAIYVIYTSGSTGQPKGVLNTHRGLYNRLRWMQRAYALKASDAILQKTPLSFDVSGWELWWPLIEGARMVIAAPEGHKDPRYLAAVLAAADVTVVHFVPSMLAVFLAATEPRERASLRLVFASGEALPEHLRAAWYAGNRGELHNLYGPTEAAIDVTRHACRPDETGPVPIGKPIDNTRTYVLDAAFRPVPVGVAGELYLSGVQLARGYLHRPGLTAERFVPDPLVRGARMYRTGDLARFRDDGALEFLGRIDHQVKIRGFRIELGEIEAAIAAHPSVRDCVVVAREDATGDKRLVAYVVGDQAIVSELRERLGATVPEYMVPSAFVFLDALPLNPSGKVDRKALPAPDASRGPAETFTAPRTDVERALVAIWEELLEVRPIGVRDDFFALGGHSLLAVRVVSAVKARLGFGLTLATLLRRPTIAALAASLAGIETQPGPALSPAPRGAAEPAYDGLSGTERRIWFVDKLAPEARSYQVPHVFVVRGALSLPALRQSVERLAERQEILRTTYPEVDGALMRRVADSVAIPLRVEDVSALSDSAREVALRAHLEAEIAVPFDLATGPLTRALVVSLAAEHHVVLVLQHHIITDEWSSGVLLSELSRLYEACCRGEAAELPALAYQFADYARAEQAALTTGGFAASRAYWKHQLAGVPRLELPIVRTGPERGPEASVTLGVPPAASRALQALARDHGCTPFMAWYAALTAVLSRYSGQTDFGLGAVIANREVAGTADLLGFFTNTVALRTDLAGDPSFAELLARARRTALDAYEHQALPFDVVVQEQGLARQAGENPLFDVTFFEVTPAKGDAAAGWSPISGPVPRGVTTAKNALAVSVQHTAEGTVVEVLYDTTRVSRVAAERLCGHLSTLVTDAAAHPNRRVSELDLLTDEETEKLAAWNDTPRTDPAARCIHELIAEQAVRAPQAVALEQDGQPLSYGEFEAQVNRLAHHLRALGVGPEVRVVLCVERSFDMVIGLVAILKAGGAFVPLDPSYPSDRLSLLLAEAGAPVLLTHAAIEDRLATPNVKVVRLDVDAAQWASQPSTPPASGVTLDHANYVVFTSGSTGKPKPVVNEHRGLAARVAFQRRHIVVHPGDRILFSAAIAFDGAIVDWMLSLCNGATCVLPSNALDAVEGIAECLEHRAITFSFIPPAMLRVLRCRAPALRHITLAGDKTSPSLVAQWAEGRQVLNSYGPTEFSIFAAQAWFDPSRPERFSIGRPVHGVRIHLLDGKMRQVPLGMPGEIHLAGVGLARGYLNRPAMTAERFVPDPFSNQPGARMYCTGDLARWNEDGELEFLGRVDHQVKIRGFRVELGEVEAALASHPAVGSAVVVAREDSPGSMRLVAYVVAKQDDLTPASLREHLRSDLPDYMLPSAFVFLDALPLSTNGKVDRKALPSPEAMRGADEAFVAPRNDVERALVAIWEQLLEVRPIGIDDDFFALGGHSLLAVRVASAVKTRLGLGLTLATLLRRPTIAALAASLVEMETRPGPALSPSPRGAAAPAYSGLSGTERRIWFVDKLAPKARSYQVPHVFVVRGALSLPALRHSVERLAEQQEILRTTYPEIDGVLMRRVADSASIPLRIEDVSTLPEAIREAALRAHLESEIGTRFDLATGPLTRALVVSLGAEHHVVLVIQHHIITDEWSSGVLLSELSRLYEACCRGEAAESPALAYQFADYARAEQEALTTGGFAASRTYWKNQLANVPRLELPIVRAAPARGPGLEASAALRIPLAVSRGLQALARAHGCTLFMAWYAAFAAVLSRYSGQQDFGLGAVIANREVPGAAELLGFFTNTVVLRTDLAGDPSFAELLARARRTALESYEHQALPFDVVVQDQGLARQAGESPLFDVTFFEVTPPTTSAGAGWSPLVEAMPTGLVTAKQALALGVLHDAEGTEVSLAYDTTRVDAGAVERLARHLQALVQDGVLHPDKRLSQLDLLTAAEHTELAAWNDTTAAYPAESCVHELFAAQARRTPAAVALVFGAQQLTYQELDERSNQLAHHLRGLGVGPEVLVALCVERSLEMVVGLLGILKAGGAYVPLDPSYPRERLAFMLTDARPAVLLTQARLRDSLPPHEVVTVHLDAGAPAWKQPRTPHAVAVGPDHPSYVLYTSGSTGRPKGVQILHAALTNLLHAFAEQTAIGPQDALLAVTSMSFDIAGLELFMPLIRGAAIHLVSRDDASDGEALVSALDRATMMQATPATWRMVLDAGWKGERPLQVLCGGEAMTPDLALELTRRASRVWNAYGPTETTIWSALSRVDAGPSPVRLGRGIANTQLHVVDKDLRQTPVGVPGELYIGGTGLARGYLGRPELTAERFVPDPFSAVPGARMYRTGDLVRWDANGQLEFLGRIDHQVKIRGFRIELGEIEAVLSSHPSVRACAVGVWEPAPGDRRLVAHVVPGEGACTDDTLREHLGAALPTYMVPSLFVRLTALPLSPSGKVDRKALPPPDATRDAVETSCVAPRSEAERVLAELWSAVLQVSPLGIHDNFFSLGGDSILALQVIGRAKRAGLHLTARDMFTHQTVAELALVVRRESAVLAEQDAVHGTVPLTPIQRWFLDADPVDAHHYCPAMRWTPPAGLSPEVAAEALRIVAAQHDAVRLRYRRSESGWVQEHEAGATLALERVDLSAVDGEARDAAALEAVARLQRAMNLSSGPICRAAWLDLGEAGAQLVLVLHHLVTDGVSWRIVCEDLQRACEALSAGRTPELGPKTTSLRQWSERLHAFVAGGGLAEELGYWQAQCARRMTAIVRDRDVAPGSFGDSRTVEVELSPADTSALLRAVGSAHGTEIDAVLLSALASALSTASATDTVCVALQHHGREPVVADVEVSRTVGWFSTLFPLWLSVQPDNDPAVLLRDVQAQLRSVPGRGLGYGWLRYAHPDASVRASLSVPMPVVFNYLGQYEAGSPWSFAGTAPSSISPNMALFHELVVSCIVVDGRLRLGWSFSSAVHDTATIERIAAAFLSSLRRIIECARGRREDTSCN
ncbi:non-ribosomal peptide synthetase [Nannocystis bainbridge]|uniref:Non-ribosomal peptide synthase/polyketide synthase n=1 Tax=Nannocystis bainbridge TaxID=2995303 RepID=A0ABT5DTC8_9BACT|nr:non-ribosomal peptide synthase/polyketide synthase [Nannocystis bainbridge]MDC0716420.1 non-ribosomal peptide synthase/polyketide synthase [Nannocystis bainbridge]